MNKQSVFPGIILIGIGMYFLMDKLNLTFLNSFYTWPSLLIIFGIVFLAQAYTSRDYQNIIPGFILFGFGIHFHLTKLFSSWPDHWAMYTLIIGCAFLLRYKKANLGLLPGLLLLILSILALFYHEVIGWLSWVEYIAQVIEKYWPIGLIGAGIYLLFLQKNKRR